MSLEELIHGESLNIEYKEMIPNNSEKYTKTVVAFANTQGGKIIFGVADNTNEIVGVNNLEIYQMMDRIASAIYNSCEPTIVPQIEPYTLDSKSLIVVTVSPGMQRPYYLKSKGKVAGTYIRVGGTTRPANADKIKELELEGTNISWDELPCIGYAVTKEAIENLCNEINKRRKDIQIIRELSGNLPLVNETNLENWNLFTRKCDQMVASNAFALLTSEYIVWSKTQCALFKGTDRNLFLDKKEFTGPLYEQIDQAVNFVCRNIRLRAEIRGLLRHECYELPVDAIREMLVNAHCHRNYVDNSYIQVAVYDDRVEVTSPGGLYGGLTLDLALNGHSRLRNRILANLFSVMGLAESWGTGLKRIQTLAKEFGLPNPEFIATSDSFRVNLYRNSLEDEMRRSKTHNGNYSLIHGDSTEKNENKLEEISEKNEGSFANSSEVAHDQTNDNNIETNPDKTDLLNTTQKRIVSLLKVNSKLSAESLAEKLGLSSRSVEYNIKKIKDLGILVRRGSYKDGYWQVIF